MQIGGILTTIGTRSAPQTVILPASLPKGNHVISIDFLNDLYGGSPTTDRNLYVQSIAVDGVTRAGSATLYDSGTKFIDVTIP